MGNAQRSSYGFLVPDYGLVAGTKFGSIRFPDSLAPIIGALPEATFTFARDHWHTEEHIRVSGLRHTFMRENTSLDFLPTLAGTNGILRRPAKGASGRWRATK